MLGAGKSAPGLCLPSFGGAPRLPGAADSGGSPRLPGPARAAGGNAARVLADLPLSCIGALGCGAALAGVVSGVALARGCYRVPISGYPFYALGIFSLTTSE